jgi:very-short-patch-repair endonuclease
MAAADDIARDRYLTERGFVVLRFTYMQVVGARREVAREVRAALRRPLDDFLPDVRR